MIKNNTPGNAGSGKALLKTKADNPLTNSYKLK
jgi:hypothetical protein